MKAEDIVRLISFLFVVAILLLSAYAGTALPANLGDLVVSPSAIGRLQEANHAP